MILKGLIALASYGFYEGAFGNVISRWEQMGVFSYALPFLLIFAVVFGILSSLKIFKEKSVNAIIALAVGLMSLQFEFVPIFFSEIFPRFGVGMGLLLVAIILLGLFFPDKPWVTYVFFTIGAIIFIVILIKTFGVLGWTLSENTYFYEWQDLIPWIVLAVLLIIVIAASSKGDDSAESILTKAVKKFT